MTGRSWQSKAALIGLLSLGAFLRLAALDRYPLPAHQDELNEVYDSYSILTTGADRSGAVHPILLRGFGENDYRPGMYAWIATIPMRLFGFSVASARIVSAVLGILSLLLIYLFARQMAGESYAFIALAFAALSPWHIIFSRLAHQGAMLPPFFLGLVYWLWQRTRASGYEMVPATVLAFALGASANAYFAARLIAPLVGLLILWDMRKFGRLTTKSGIAFALAAFIGAIPQFIALVQDTNHFFFRARSTLLDISHPVTASSGLVANVAWVMSPRYLFWPAMIDTGLTPVRLLPIDAIFLSVGLFAFAKLRSAPGSLPKRYVYLGLLISILPALITTRPHAIRESAILAFLPLFSAAGVTAIGDSLRGSPWIRRWYFAAAAFTIIASFAFVTYMYIFSQYASSQRSNYALVKVGKKLRHYAPCYRRVFITDSASHPDLYVVVYSGMLPQTFQKVRKVYLNKNGWDVARQIDKFYFRSPLEIVAQEKRSVDELDGDLFVTRDRFPAMQVIDSASWNSDKFYFQSLRPGCIVSCSPC